LTTSSKLDVSFSTDDTNVVAFYSEDPIWINT